MLATFNAYYQFDITQLDFNRFIENLESFRLDQNVFDPWEDRFTLFTPNEAVVLHGNGFDYDTNAQMYQGVVEAVSEWFYDTNTFAWTQAYLLSDLNLSALDLYNALQSAATGDDNALIRASLSGDDMFNMSQFDDHVRGYRGSDTIRGRDGADILYGNKGADELRGGGGNDALRGGSGQDNLFGGKDDDLLHGGSNDDLLKGNAGGDNLIGGRGDDALRGGSGKDALFGAQGSDLLFGGAGNDILRGGAGEDVVRGGTGLDHLYGGADEDLFVFSTGDDVDIIEDLEVSFLGYDRIDLSGLASVTSWQDLKSNHMTQDGSDVVIDGGDGDMLILSDTSIDSLVKMLFDF